ncbi:MAG: zinc-ribbon domain-containing protein, partial [Erysipelotrichaceae bacterium]|nr:zinc-ribbon domain-containing protein [Erysipelotrichaceae bacterium]
MYCPKCGKKVQDTSRFCPFCGSPVIFDTDTQGQNNKTQKKNHTIWIIAGLVIVLAVCGAAGGYWYYNKQKQEKYEQISETADKFFKEQKYTEAEDSYLAALEIDPKIKTPYVPLYTIYSETDQPEKAETILKKAQEILPETDYQEVKKEAEVYREETEKHSKERQKKN